MLDPVSVFRLCGKLRTLRKEHRLLHIVILYGELAKLLSLGIFDMVCFCTQEILRMHRNRCLKYKIVKQ